jgi:hypothetical protein
LSAIIRKFKNGATRKGPRSECLRAGLLVDHQTHTMGAVELGAVAAAILALFGFLPHSGTMLITQMNPGELQGRIPYFSFFLILASLLGCFVLLSLVSYNFQVLNTCWVYMLLLLEAMQMIFVEVGLSCFTGNAWCNSDAKLQTATLIVMVVFVVVVVLRSYCYCPLYETDNPLSMYFSLHPGILADPCSTPYSMPLSSRSPQTECSSQAFLLPNS